MTTANDIITGALELVTSLSPGEGIPGAEADAALRVLNRMMKGWSTDNLMPPFATLESFAVAQGVNSRTVGSGAQLNTTRPDYIVSAYLRDSNGLDYPPLAPITSAQYDAIAQKTQTARPEWYFYDPQYPSGVLYFDAATDAAYTLFLRSVKPFNQFATINTAMDLPGEYEEIISHLLVEPLAPRYGTAITPDVRKLIEDAKRRIRRKNVRRAVAAFDPLVTPTRQVDIDRGF